MAARKHADVIKAWADGAQIQCRPPQVGLENRRDWRDNSAPAFVDDWEYRVKPVEPARVYPLTQMTGDQLHNAACEYIGDGHHVRMANAALRHAIDAGQVVMREEFDRMCGDRRARDMAVADAVKRVCQIAVEEACVGFRTVAIAPLDLAAIIAGIEP